MIGVSSKVLDSIMEFGMVKIKGIFPGRGRVSHLMVCLGTRNLIENSCLAYVKRAAI